jgi:hypothetical protein
MAGPTWNQVGAGETAIPGAPLVAVEKLAAYVQVDAVEDAAYLAECVQEAADLVQDLITRNKTRPVPESVAERAELETGADLFHRRRSRNGVAVFGSGDDLGGMEAVRVTRDPSATARAMLAAYLGPVIG